MKKNMEILVNGKIKNITLYNLCRVDVAQECMEAAADIEKKSSIRYELSISRYKKLANLHQ